MNSQQPVSDPRQQQCMQRMGARNSAHPRSSTAGTFGLIKPGSRAVPGIRAAVGLIPLIIVLLTSCGMGHPGPENQATHHPFSEEGAVAGKANLTPIHPDVQPAAISEKETQTAAQINALFTGLVAQQQFSGSVLIARDGQVLLEQGYGMANWATQVPNQVHTRFFLGSVTKEFTATAILLLQQQGKLRVQNSICAYVVPCPPPWQPVTLHEILTHTSGIPELHTEQISGSSPTAWVASFDNAGLAFTPGSQFAYCSVCYQILAYVVQVVSGQPYQNFVQSAILTPLHLTETGFNANFYYAQKNDAHGYATWQNEAMQLGWDVDPKWSFLFGSGLLYSTVTDLARWDQALATNTLLDQQSRNAAITSYTNSSLFAGSTYGYGWFIAKSPVAGHRLIWHDGVIDGFRTYIGRYIDDNVTIIFLSNLATVDSPTLAQSVQQLIFKSV